MEYEDERRWLLLDGSPNLHTNAANTVLNYQHIVQFYLPTTVGSLRFRYNGNRCVQTIKGPRVGSKKPESNREVELWEFDLMRQSSIGEITKTRTDVVVDGYTFELDHFLGPLECLVIVELEFHPSENLKLDEVRYKKFQQLVLPTEVFEPNIEITEDDTYSNYQLAVNGSFPKSATGQPLVNQQP